MKNNMKSLTAIMAIVVILASLLFLVVEITPLFIMSYVFILVSIFVVWFSIRWMIKNAESYPWVLAIPMSSLTYLFMCILFSGVIVAAEQLHIFVLPIGWFIFIQAAIFALYAIRIILLNAGKVEVERREVDVRESISTIKSLTLDMESILLKSSEEMKNDIKLVLDILKYSDPVGNPSIVVVENNISETVKKLDNAVINEDKAKVCEYCSELQGQIKDRNNIIKQAK